MNVEKWFERVTGSKALIEDQMDTIIRMMKYKTAPNFWVNMKDKCECRELVEGSSLEYANWYKCTHAEHPYEGKYASCGFHNCPIDPKDIKDEPEKVPLITEEFARQQWNVVEVICPELHMDEMIPKFQLRDPSKCPMGLQGKCGDECTYFMGASSEDGTFSAHGVYNGFCDSKEKENNKGSS